MADASIDIRIFPNKELTSVDMAELMDTAIPNTGVIQGCELQLVNGVFHISSGRIVVKGRLGVVTEGTIPNPTTLTQTATCWPMAICDLSNTERPFYFLVATANDLDRLGLATEDENSTFNVDNGIAALTFGYCTVNPTTGLASDYHALAQSTARKGWDWYNRITTEMETYIANKLTWTTFTVDNLKGQTWVTVPVGSKEIYVEVYTSWNANQKLSSDFYLPINGWVFSTSSGSKIHTNHWGQTWDGVAAIETRITNNTSQLRLLYCYNGTSNVTANTFWRAFYR